MHVKRWFRYTTSLSLLFLTTTAYSGPDRWYSASQVGQGEQLFIQNCASCHGNKAEATSNWQKTLPNGKYPPPPLNGTAHAWHHPKKILERQVLQGGEKLGGWMPAFKGKLTDTEVDAVIAYFQSKWNDEIYMEWSNRNQSKGLQPVKNSVNTDSKVDTSLLEQRLKSAKVKGLTETSIKDIYQVKIGGNYLYLTKDGRYVFSGQLIDLKTGRNLTEIASASDTKEGVNSFPEEYTVIYSAQGKEKSKITIFTDTTCPYCRKLHAEIPKLTSAGVTVRYIAYPRGGSEGDGYENMKSVWCSDNPQIAINIAMGEAGGKLLPGTCNKADAVDAGYQLGNQIGLKGTPLIILPDGRKISGYLTATQILKRLNI